MDFLDSLSGRLLVPWIGADKNEVVDLENYAFFNKLFEVDNNLEVVENIVYENLEDFIDGLKECNVTKD